MTTTKCVGGLYKFGESIFTSAKRVGGSFVGVSTGVFSQKHMKEKPDTLTCDRVIKTALVMFSDAPVHNLKNPSAEREERHTL